MLFLRFSLFYNGHVHIQIVFDSVIIKLLPYVNSTRCPQVPKPYFAHVYV